MLLRKKSHLQTGQRGEELALQCLRKNGYEILEHNYRQPFGEVDLIARHHDTIVFIEVKTRRSGKFGSPLEAVDRNKQRQLVKIAQDYLIRNDLTDSAARFDVVGVYLPEGRKPQINIVDNAFELTE